LAFNEKPLLKGKGTISKAEMEEKVREIYRMFDVKRKKYEAIQADQEDLAELKFRLTDLCFSGIAASL
jgi:hypothetical protein